MNLPFSSIAKHYGPNDLATLSDRQKSIAIAAVQTCLASYTMDRRIPLTARTARFLRTNLRTLRNAFPEDWYTTRWNHQTGTETDYVVIPDGVTIDSLQAAN